VSEEEFRYPGPKPQTRETAIVMLADSVEAVSRTLEDPKPGRLLTAIKKVIETKFTAGQLEECDLTLKDLHKIEESFLKILLGVFHSRIEYPSPSESRDTESVDDTTFEEKDNSAFDTARTENGRRTNGSRSEG